MERAFNDSDAASRIITRVHELVASTAPTHPDVEARAALDSALLELEVLRERICADVMAD